MLNHFEFCRVETSFEFVVRHLRFKHMSTCVQFALHADQRTVEVGLLLNTCYGSLKGAQFISTSHSSILSRWLIVQELLRGV